MSDYSKYSISELKEAYDAVNKEKYPENYFALKKILSEKEESHNDQKNSKLINRKKKIFSISIKSFSFFIKIKLAKNIYSDLNGHFSQFFSSTEMNGDKILFENTVFDYLSAKLIRFNFQYKIYRIFHKVKIKRVENGLIVTFNILHITLDMFVTSIFIYLIIPNSYEGVLFYCGFMIFMSIIFGNKLLNKIGEVASYKSS